MLRAAGDDEGMTLRIDIGGLPSGRLRFAASPLAEQIYVLTSTENFEKPTEVCEWTEAEYEEWLAWILTVTLLQA